MSYAETIDLRPRITPTMEAEHVTLVRNGRPSLQRQSQVHADDLLFRTLPLVLRKRADTKMLAAWLHLFARTEP